LSCSVDPKIGRENYSFFSIIGARTAVSKLFLAKFGENSVLLRPLHSGVKGSPLSGGFRMEEAGRTWRLVQHQVAFGDDHDLPAHAHLGDRAVCHVHLDLAQAGPAY